MRAIRHIGYHTFPEIREIEKPQPGPGEVLLKVAGAGACHSDVAIFNEFDAGLVPKMDPEFTLGHENSGWVEELGAGVSGINIGDAYLVYGPVGCNHCRACSRGQDTYCENIAQMDYLGIGLGRDGGMAEYVVVPARNLIPLGDADPVKAAPLADAGLTPYHAIKLALGKLAGGGKTVLVIGLGGLGLIGVQILKALTGAKIIATDSKAEAMQQAKQYGAVTVASGTDQAAEIRALTPGGKGVDAVFDFVGVGATVQLAMQSVVPQGRVTVVGLGNLTPYEWAFMTTAYEAELLNTYWGTIEDLYEVVDMFKAGQIEPQITTYTMDQALEAYQLLVDGKIHGRAIITPNA